jgi:hypothetical protein
MYHKSRKPKEFLKLLMHAERLVRRKKKQNGGQKKRKGSNIICCSSLLEGNTYAAFKV